MKRLIFVLVPFLVTACETAQEAGAPSLSIPPIQEAANPSAVPMGLDMRKDTVQLHSFDDLSDHTFPLLIPDALPERYFIFEIFESPHSVRMNVEKDAGDLTVELGSIVFVQSSGPIARPTENALAEGRVPIPGGEADWAEYPGERLVISWNLENGYYQVEGEQAELEECLLFIEHLKPLQAGGASASASESG